VTEKMHVVSRDARGVPAWKRESKLTPEERKRLGLDDKTETKAETASETTTSFEGGRVTPRRSSKRASK